MIWPADEGGTQFAAHLPRNLITDEKAVAHLLSTARFSSSSDSDACLLLPSPFCTCPFCWEGGRKKYGSAYGDEKPRPVLNRLLAGVSSSPCHSCSQCLFLRRLSPAEFCGLQVKRGGAKSQNRLRSYKMSV